MHIIVESEEEAKEKVLELTKEVSTEFCPLIFTTCRKDCVCYIPATYGKTRINTKDIYKVYQGGCGNGMFEERPQLEC